MERHYICIDLKSFYASIECVERGLNAMTTNLVVADASRTEKTICLAVSPSLKKYGIGGRARLFEVVQKINQVNNQRRKNALGRVFRDASFDDTSLVSDPSLEVSYITAPPRMALYMKYSTMIYNIYLKYVSSEDIHTYSVDEVFIDVTAYLETYKTTPHKLAEKMIKDVLETTGITATVGIGTNMYLAKIAMDIVAKHMPADENGARIAQLDVMNYRKTLWSHRPLTDFWRVGRGYSKKLEEHGLYTMGDIARCSLGKPDEYYNEDLLYKLFGINAELLIDHAWGIEPCTMKEIKEYKPQSSSMGSGQVLHCPYTADKARLVVREMIDMLVLDLVDKNLVTDQIVLTIGYDIDNLTDNIIRKLYKGPVTTDIYGRKIPKQAHGSINIGKYTSSGKLITEKTMELYDKIVNKDLLVRRMNVVANRVIVPDKIPKSAKFEQLDLLVDYEARDAQQQKENKLLEKEKNLQKALINIKKQFGKNAVVKGMNMQEGATAMERNKQIGGHSSGEDGKKL